MALGKSGLGFLISENKDSHGDIIKVLQDGNDEGERENLQLGWADSSQKCKEERTVDWAQGTVLTAGISRGHRGLLFPLVFCDALSKPLNRKSTVCPKACFIKGIRQC